MKNKIKKVLIGMSGGVDSSVAALLLKKEGYEVAGIFIDFIGSKKSEQDFQLAQKIAKKLDISIYKLDAQEIFKKKIIDKFVADYKRGTTPNPCVICNPEMKFKILIEEADKQGIERVATGHYARIMEHETWSMEQEINNIKQTTHNIEQDTKYKIQDTSKFKISNLTKRIGDIFEKKITPRISNELQNKDSNRDPRIREDDNFVGLMKGRDDEKDQSYFLYRLTQMQLARIIFPLGEYLKSEVREIAQKKGFGIKDEDESQDICFIANDDFNKFIAERIVNKPGKIVDSLGNVLGKHEGLHFYTIGQRKGINLGGDGPYFVVKKDLAKNKLVVANNFIESLWRDEFEIKNVNWIESGLKFPLETNVKIRYRTEEICAIIDEIDGVEGKARKTYRVKLDQPQKAITPGQSAVFYSKEGEVWGGGIII